MTIQLGQVAPDFEQNSTHGPIRFHEWLGSSWGLLFSHPKNFTPVCTTELGEVAKLRPEWDKRNVKPIGLSVDPVEAHHKWEKDIEETQGARLDFPMIADPDGRVAALYDMIHPDCDPAVTVRSVFVIDPAKKVRLILTYPPSTGRNFCGDPARDRQPAVDRRTQHRHPGQLDARRAGGHFAEALRRRSHAAIPPRIPDAQALSANCRSPSGSTMTAASAPEHPASAEDGQLARLFERNAKWAEGKTDIDPGFFQRLVDQQKPRYFWIGCSDSRVPATEIVDLDPGEMFVHRNVANLTKPDDPNFLAALQFAVDVLKVEHVIVVGHYGCGGVHAAMNGGVPGAISRWLEPLGALHAMYASPAEAMTQLHIAIAIAFLGGIGFSACAKRFIAWLAA